MFELNFINGVKNALKIKFGQSPIPQRIKKRILATKIIFCIHFFVVHKIILSAKICIKFGAGYLN
jgi:hypothetical protein